MRKFFTIISIFLVQTISAQVYTSGGAAQLYWDWRPDIASNCYEFTYEIYTKVNLLPPHYDLKVGLCYWNNCNYGKNIVDSNCQYLQLPLRDTLYRVTSYYGIRDTMCGFDMPYNPGADLNYAQKTSPVRTKLVYKGLVHLPEKCNRWYFSIANFFQSNAHNQFYFSNGTESGLPGAHIHSRSNIDSFYYAVPHDSILKSYYGFMTPIGCSFDNTLHSNNSSSRFITQVPHYFPIHKPIVYNAGNLDPDHDSIVYTIPDTIKQSVVLMRSTWVNSGRTAFCHKNNKGIPVDEVFTTNYYFATLPGATGPNPARYNAQNNPFDTDSSFHMVDSTGKITFTATRDMEPILYIKATEYRSGKFLSETFLINQFTLINENREPSYMHIDTPSVQNALFNSEGTLMSCTGLPIRFEAYVKLPSVGGDLIVRTTADTTLPGNGTCHISTFGTDSARLTMNWTPPSDARGLYNVYVSAKDTHCAPPYHQYLQVFTWSFYIDSCVSPLQTSAISALADIKVYPNPSGDQCQISSTEEFKTVQVYNVYGQKVYGQKFQSVTQHSIDIRSWPPGVYLLNIDSKYMRKLVVAR